MAKYDVTHSCGHTATHQIYGPGKERERKLDWLSTTLCYDCYATKRDAERAAGNAAAAESNQVAGLVPLVGSPKQIAWAESIRAPICAALRAIEANPNLHAELSEAAREEAGDAIILVVDEVVSRTDSKWWIEAGQYLLAKTERDARDYVVEQIEERNLTPVAAAELVAIRERKKAEKIAREDAERALDTQLCAAFSADGLQYDEAGRRITGTVAGHTIECDLAGGCYAAVKIDGAIVAHATCLRDRVQKWGQERATAAYHRRIAEACASLAGVHVARVEKTGTKLTVTLTDGRVLRGASSRSGWELTEVWASAQAWKIEDRVTIDADHPEATRLAIEAKAAHKAAGKVGA
jgi:hypothetical protein